jgi:hypothetical protein
MSEVFKGLPRRIHIGYMTFRVVLTRADGPGDLGELDYGSTDFTTGTIYLIETLDLQQAFNTVIHEVRHAVHFTQGLEDEATEEEFVNRGTNGEIEMWVRNPRFYLWQTRTLRALRKHYAKD